MPKLKKLADGIYSFRCHGCGYDHQVWTKAQHPGGPTWTFNGNLENPTFTPSLNITTGSFADPNYKDDPEIPPTRCHIFITDGVIQYLGDCTHKLKGTNVLMDPI